MQSMRPSPRATLGARLLPGSRPVRVLAYQVLCSPTRKSLWQNKLSVLAGRHSRSPVATDHRPCRPAGTRASQRFGSRRHHGPSE
jgi:hypothetical protein